jgi:hypothetical protein
MEETETAKQSRRGRDGGAKIQGTDGRAWTTRSQGRCREIINSEGAQRWEGSEETAVRMDDEAIDGEVLNSKLTNSKVLDSKVYVKEVIGSKALTLG